MQPKIYQDLELEERAEAMALSALKREEINYTHKYTEEELAKKREQLADVVTDIIDIEEEKTQYMQSFNTKKKDKEGVRNTLVEQIRNKSEQRFEGCYKYPDYANRRIGYYDRYGILVYERAMTPDEMQREMQFNDDGEKVAALPQAEDPNIQDVDFEDVEKADEANKSEDNE